MASYEDKKKADRERIAAKREKEKSQGVVDCRKVSREVADVAHTDTYTNINKKTLSASDDAVDHPKDGIHFLTTKRKRKLNGKRFEAFNRFWDAFGYKKGKREAADAWLDIPELTNGLMERIIDAAGKEALRRPHLLAENKTPKMAQGWISGRRWEDEEYTPPKPKSSFVG